MPGFFLRAACARALARHRFGLAIGEGQGQRSRRFSPRRPGGARFHPRRAPGQSRAPARRDRKCRPAPAPARPDAAAPRPAAPARPVRRAWPARRRARRHRHAVAQNAVAQLGAGAVEAHFDGSADCGAAHAAACRDAISSRWRGLANRLSARGSTRASCARWRRRSSIALRETAQKAALEIQRLGQQFGAHRHRQFGGGGGRGRAHVGGEIDQGGVGLMPHRRDQRNEAGGRGAHHRFVVEGHQVFDRAAAARHDDQVGPRQALAVKGVEAGDGGGDLRRPPSRPAPPPATAAPGGESAHSAGA